MTTTSQPPAPSTSRFARLPQLAGSTFIPLGLFARLPLAMLTVGTLTLVTSVSGSYAIGGTAAGAVGIGSALGAPVLGALADRRGQRGILLVSALLNAAAVLALIALAYSLPSSGSFAAAADEGFAAAAPVLAAAFLAGVSCPQVGPLARVRWMALTSGAGHGSSAGQDSSTGQNTGTDLDTALSYESTADELTFVLGPALVGLLASFVAPWLPLALAAALTLTLVPAFAVHPTHRAVPRSGKQRSGRHHRAAAKSPAQRGSTAAAVPARRRIAASAAVAVPVLAMVCMGTFFGSTQTALISFSATYAAPEAAGLLYSVMGLSSAAAAFSVAYWPAQFTAAARWLACAAAMAGLSALLLLPETVESMVLTLLLLGLPVGPVMVTAFAVGGMVAPAGRLSTVMTALAGGIVAGTAAGSSIAGQLAQGQGYTAAFIVAIAAAVALFVLGLAAAVVIRSSRRKQQLVACTPAP
ncbi:MFS transporter [Arthrobacter sp. NPDC093125]|uniref:MFS transporter n=1 Tax=Arthrobacter sp. NPDC093125 TaxID=3363944 RepID=UPI003807578E